MGQGFMSWLRSNEDEIIGSLELQAEILVKSVSVLVDLMNDYSKLHELGTKIEELEKVSRRTS